MLLFDTCTLIWWISEEERLSETVRERAAVAPEVFVSAVSLWEILVKHETGKLSIDSGTQSVFDFLVEQVQAADFRLLELRPGDVRHLANLPPIHRDPFDRMLICQTIEQGLTFVTPDPLIRKYAIRTLW